MRRVCTYRLVHGHVDDMCRDTRCDDQVTLTLLLELFSSIFGTVEDTVNCHHVSISVLHFQYLSLTVDSKLLLVLLDTGLKDRLRDSHTSIRNHDVQFSKVLHNLSDQLFHFLRI
jgi:hypothetical protein